MRGPICKASASRAMQQRQPEKLRRGLAVHSSEIETGPPLDPEGVQVLGAPRFGDLQN